MKFKLTILILLVAALLSCSNSNYTWVKLHGEGLRESQNTTHCLLVINSKVAFLGGGYTSDENFKNRTFLTGQEATLYKTMVIAVTSSSLLGATHKLFISSDKGTTWSAEKFPFPLIVKPFCFLGNGELWAHGGGRLIQKRVLRF
jgi:hypothetical protein